MMKQAKILVLVAVLLLPLTLMSCGLFGGGSVSGGWAGTAFRDGIIYAGTRDGRVVAINASSRQQQWQWPDADASRSLIYTTPVVDGDLVYLGTYSGQIYALTVARGIERWVYPRTGSIGAIVGSPVVSNETIYATSSDSMIYALETTYGDLKWKSEILDEEGKRHEKLWTSQVVHNGAVYVSTFDGHIYALSAETGELGWSFEAEAGFASSPVIDDDVIYVGSFDRHLYAVKIGSTEPEWRFPRDKAAGDWFWASSVVNGGIVYAGCLDGKLYAINATTGTEMWSYMTEDSEGRPSRIISSPVRTDNLLIVVNESGAVYIFDLGGQIGNEIVPLKTISIGADVKSSFCAYDGLVYVRSENNSVYVVDIDEGEVADGWPISLTVGE